MGTKIVTLGSFFVTVCDFWTPLGAFWRWGPILGATGKQKHPHIFGTLLAPKISKVTTNHNKKSPGKLGPGRLGHIGVSGGGMLRYRRLGTLLSSGAGLWFPLGAFWRRGLILSRFREKMLPIMETFLAP